MNVIDHWCSVMALFSEKTRVGVIQGSSLCNGVDHSENCVTVV